MKFHRLADVPISADDQVFKASPVRGAIWVLVFSGITIVALVFAIEGSRFFKLPSGMFYCGAAVFGLIGLFALAGFRACLKPSNWLLRCGREGVIIKFRSYQNWKLPDRVQAVELDYGEIAWARIVKERRTSAAMMPERNRETQTTLLTFLELGLASPDVAQLERHLSDEINFRPENFIVSVDFPVSLSPEGVLELRWNGISPSAHQAIAPLGQRVKVEDAERRKVDLTYDPKVSDAEDRARIIVLAKSGDEIGAMKLAQQVYHYSPGEASEFVDKLLGRTDSE